MASRIAGGRGDTTAEVGAGSSKGVGLGCARVEHGKGAGDAPDEGSSCKAMKACAKILG